MSDELAQEAPGANTDEQKPTGIFARIRAWARGSNGVVIEDEEKILKVDRSFIERVFPTHSGKWLLLHGMELTQDKVVGFWLVTEELCTGHGIGKDIVLPGVLLIEAANQTMGIWYATQHPELIGTGKIFFARRGDYQEGEDIDPEDDVEIFKRGRYKASSFIEPGDLVRIEVKYADLSGSMTTKKRGTFIVLTGKNFLFKVGEDLKGSVELVELKSVEPPKIAPST